MNHTQEAFLNALKVERNFSEHTLKSHQDDLIQLNQFLEQEHLQLNTFEYRDARDYLSRLYSNHLKRTSVSRKILTLRTFYEYRMTLDRSIINPFVQLVHPKKEKYLPQFFYEEEMEALFKTVEEDASGSLRDRVILELLCATGIRVSELISIKKQDIDFYANGVAILGKGNKEHFVSSGTYCRQSIENYLEHFKPIQSCNHDFPIVNIRGEAITERGIRYVLDDIVKRTTGVSEIRPHKLRHTFATHLLNQSVGLRTVQSLLGRVNLLTADKYIHVSNQQLRKVYPDAHPRAKKEDET